MEVVRFHVFGVDEDVVEVDDDGNIKEIGEDVVHEVLECCWRVCQSKRHYPPLERPISGSECSFPLVACGDADQVVGMVEIYFGIDACLSGCIKKVGGERKWVSVLLGDCVETPEGNAESE